MAMEPKGVVASLALHTVLEPIFTEVGTVRATGTFFTFFPLQMEREEAMLASVQTLRDAFTKVIDFLSWL